jgi:hypothetical protein
MLKSVMVAGALVAATLTGPCNLATGLKDGVVVGTWGGDNAGLIAADTSAHVHIACTYGNVHQGIEPDGQGRFDVPGDYVLRAYPVAVGPTLPARFSGTVDGAVMRLAVTVTDTTADTTAHLGPVRLVFGQEPKMQMCPICRRPGERRNASP